VLLAISGFADYSPINADASATKLVAAEVELTTSEKSFATQKIAYDSARDDLVAKQWAFHNCILAGKKAVVGQYDEDSEEVQAVGYTKASEKRAPKTAKKNAAA
jgi:hypothetical protein